MGHNQGKEINKLKLAKQKLQSVFGYTAFRSKQEDIISAVLDKHNCVVIMPTGSGKSLCYQIPALVLDGIAIVISPLISLMKNQVTQLHEVGVEAEFINSTLTSEEYFEVVEKLRQGITKILYLAPETLALPRTIELLQELNISFLAIDEAHCISEWGHDFRPEYRQIAEVRENLGSLPTIALTATATPRVQDDIANNLRLGMHKFFNTSFDRKNLYLEVMPKSNPYKQTKEFLQKFPNESAIIYCFSRKGVDSLTEKLQEDGFNALAYHAGLDNEERKISQEKFIKDDVQIIVATIAFGMGIDKPNIRAVLHYDLPKDIESYYQQIGRAGRDGSKAFCLLLFGYQDVNKIKFFFQDKVGNELQIAYKHLESMLDFSETNECRRKVLLNYFGEEYQLDNCETCDNCLKTPVEKEDLTIPVQKFLSTVWRTDQFFGSKHIINILRGSKDKKVLERNHHKLSTYGIGLDLSTKQWLHLFRQMQREKIIDVDPKYGSIRMTNSGISIMKSQEKFFGVLIEEKSKVTKQIAKVDFNYDQELFDLLRAKRKEIADQKRIPPYTILHDKAIREIAATFPQTPEDLLQISGIGESKLQKYGKIILDIVVPFVIEREL
jgi:ATP-dependent DNA helicase RecQ